MHPFLLAPRTLLFPQDLPNKQSILESQMEGKLPYSVTTAREMAIPLIDAIGFMVFLTNFREEEEVVPISLPTERHATLGQNMQLRMAWHTTLNHNLQCCQD